MMDISADSSYFETTYTQDVRIEEALRQERHIRDEETRMAEEERTRIFKEVLESQEAPIFHLRGLRILKFTSVKLKFSFTPHEVADQVSMGAIFHFSLVYMQRYGTWRIKHDTFPGNYKWRIYPMFYEGQYFAVTDDLLTTVIVRIHKKLIDWAKRESKYRLEKYARYQNGEDVFLDEDDEELFLTSAERSKLHNERWKILKRMIPPKRRTRPTRRRRT